MGVGASLEKGREKVGRGGGEFCVYYAAEALTMARIGTAWSSDKWCGERGASDTLTGRDRGLRACTSGGDCVSGIEAVLTEIKSEHVRGDATTGYKVNPGHGQLRR